MTLQTCEIVLAGHVLAGAYDGTNYYINVPAIEKVLDWRKDSTREKLRSESLKAFAGKVLQPVKRKADTRGFVNLITAKDFSIILTWAAIGGSSKAAALLAATNTEAIERRIDSQLQIEPRTEDSYEDSTRHFYRELARKSFQPELCSWFQSHHVINYGAEVNLFKRALGLPLVNVDSYSNNDMQTWSKGITSYNALRMEGFGHTRALSAVGRHVAAKESS